ncbi:MAG: inositol monophosphatase family protein [Ilumatobacteraceae bacterium]
MDPLVNELALAVRLADAADAVSLAGYRSRDFSVERKADNSEVTEIDRATERAISDVLRSERPTHGIYGEEHGITGDIDAEFQWVIDPIDATTNFIRGVPVWGSLIALVHEDVPVLGIVSAPALGFRWWAKIGAGAFCNGSQIHVSAVSTISEAHVSITPNTGWSAIGRMASLEQLQVDAQRARGFGDFWQHMLVAQGALDVAVDAIGLQPYDTAALYPIVQEAGGRMSDRHGASNWRANSLVSSNGVLHDEVITRLA